MTFDTKTFKFDLLLSNCYVLNKKEVGAVIVIDPFISEDLFDYISKLNPRDVLIILTHEHFDHTTGVNEVKNRFDAKLICSESCAKRISQKRNNRPLSIMGNAIRKDRYKNLPNYECSADITFGDNFKYDWFGTELRFFHTPGHSVGSICIEIGDYVFVGDSALLNQPTLTRFPTGDQLDYNEKTIPYLLEIVKEKIIMPGHGDSYRLSDVEWCQGCFCVK